VNICCWASVLMRACLGCCRGCGSSQCEGAVALGRRRHPNEANKFLSKFIARSTGSLENAVVIEFL
jgi:hypothetical protein